MIQALRYEPQGQRQRFEEAQQQEQDRHIHLHLHLHLGRRIHRASPFTVARLTTLFAAFIGALSMALTLSLQVGARNIPTQAPLFNLAGNLMLFGSLFGFAAVLVGGLPLVISAWRSTPRSRNLFLVPLYALGQILLAILLSGKFSGLYGLSSSLPGLLLAILVGGISLVASVRLLRQRSRALFLILLYVLGVIVLFFFVPSGVPSFGPYGPPPTFDAAAFLLGLLAMVVAGMPLAVAVWRSTTRSRVLFMVPLYALTITVLYAITYLQRAGIFSIPDGYNFGNIQLALLFYGLPLVSTIAINHAIRQTKIADRWLRFASHLSRLVVLAMLLMLIGVVLWGFALALYAPDWFFVLVPLLTFPWNSWLLIALGMLLAVIVALWTSFSHVQTPVSQPLPHDDPPHDWTSSNERGDVPGDLNREWTLEGDLR